MPPKDIHDAEMIGTFPDGTTFVIKGVEAVDLTPKVENIETGRIRRIMTKPIEGEIHIDSHFRLWLSFAEAAGVDLRVYPFLSNNWLRMYHKPMRRKHTRWKI
jgi:hypothetical protein